MASRIKIPSPRNTHRQSRRFRRPWVSWGVSRFIGEPRYLRETLAPCLWMERPLAWGERCVAHGPRWRRVRGGGMKLFGRITIALLMTSLLVAGPALANTTVATHTILTVNKHKVQQG